MIGEARSSVRLDGETHVVAQPRERPILFKGELVRAILEGRKTVTRRLLTPQPCRSLPHTKGLPGGDGTWVMHHPLGWRWQKSKHFSCYVADESDVGFAECLADHSPYGRAGDRLWVKETWRAEERATDRVDGIRFSADDAFVRIENTRAAADAWVEAYDNGRHGTNWRPSIFMPRWASRLTLEITSVRAERLQDITEDDAKAEGVEPLGPPLGKDQPILADPQRRTNETHPHTLAFACKWDEINGDREGAVTWADNPWCWVLNFRTVQQ